MASRCRAGSRVDVPAGSDAASSARSTARAQRAYLAVRGGFDVPGLSRQPRRPSRSDSSAATADARCAPAMCCSSMPARRTGVAPRAAADASAARHCARHGKSACIYGPHGAPDFFTDETSTTFFDTDWEVHYNSSRTGVRLIGPKPKWARNDGGEAGLHPSNIHDNAYAIGAIDFTGDMPVILGPDGPSLGGFVCPATVIARPNCGNSASSGPATRSASSPSIEAAAQALEHAQDCSAARSRRSMPRVEARSDTEPPIVRSLARDAARRRRGLSRRPATDTCWSSSGRRCSI